jgi:hypothetical protein
MLKVRFSSIGGKNRGENVASLWNVVTLDLMGPYQCKPRGKFFVLVATDLFFRWTEALPTPNSTIDLISPLLKREVFAL